MNEVASSTLDATIDDVTTINQEVIKVTFRTSNPLPSWQPGQYLLWHVSPKGHHAPFSIASRHDNDDPHRLQLHIRLNPQSEMGQRITERLADTTTQTALTLPLGQCHYGRIDANRPLVILAGSTGFAQAKPIFEQTLADQWAQPVYLFWGNVSGTAFYDLDQLAAWSKPTHHWAYAVTSGDSDTPPGGLNGLVHEAALSQIDMDTLRQSQILISGSPNMVYSIVDTLTELGVPESAFLSDVFDYAPR